MVVASPLDGVQRLSFSYAQEYALVMTPPTR
jgi:hypothetical protein